MQKEDLHDLQFMKEYSQNSNQLTHSNISTNSTNLTTQLPHSESELNLNQIEKCEEIIGNITILEKANSINSTNKINSTMIVNNLLERKNC